MKSNEVLLSGRTDEQYCDLISELSELQHASSGSLRLKKNFNAVNNDWVIYIRPRTFSEFLYELILADPEERYAIKKEVHDALEHAFRPMIAAARAAACRDKQLEDDVKSPMPSNLRKASRSYDQDNATTLLDDADAEDDPVGKVGPSQYVATLERLLDVLGRRALGIKSSVDKAIPQINSCFASASANVSASVPHFYITRRSALEFTANNVIVGSVNALAVGKANADASLKRAFSAFKEGWNSAKLRCELPKFVKKDNENQLVQDDEDQLEKSHESTNLSICHATLMPVNGLEHIEKLVCIPDDINRMGIGGFKDLERKKWKEFYMAGCKSMHGSIVRELYPNRYISDSKNKGAVVPRYSENNIAGAVDAAFELTNPGRQDGENPVSFMFAGLNEVAYKKIQNEIEKRPPARPAYNSELPTPEKVLKKMGIKFGDGKNDDEESTLLI